MNVSETTAAAGADVLPFLADLYPQLYLKPGEPSAAEYRDVVLAGVEPSSHSLTHFCGSSDDSAVFVQTPAGCVLTVTLQERSDFECALQILAEKCQPIPIPATQGASMLDGLISWKKIRAHEAEYRSDPSHTEADWDEEFRRFTSDKRNITDALILCSAGPYSAVAAECLGKNETDWLRESVVIRKYHELNHFICRRLYPERISPIWDELAADAIGIYAAYGSYDVNLAGIFLGIRNGVYRKGRLENYVNEPHPAEKQVKLDSLAGKIHPVLLHFQDLFRTHPGITPFEAVNLLEDNCFTPIEP